MLEKFTYITVYLDMISMVISMETYYANLSKRVHLTLVHDFLNVRCEVDSVILNLIGYTVNMGCVRRIIHTNYVLVSSYGLQN